MRIRYHDIYEAFFRNVIARKEGCWSWRGWTTEGYGNFQFENKAFEAHRVSWMIYRGPIPEGLSVLHHCDNRICPNPDCLFLGTQGDNMIDMAQKGRAYCGTRHWKAVLEEQDVRKIRALYASGVRQTSLAVEFGVTQTQVSNIVRRKSWAHVV